MIVNAPDFENESYVLVVGTLKGSKKKDSIISQIHRIDKYNKTLALVGDLFDEIESVNPIKVDRNNIINECGFSEIGNGLYQNGDIVVAVIFDKSTQQDCFYLIVHTPSENIEDVVDRYRIRFEYVHQLQKIDGYAKRITF